MPPCRVRPFRGDPSRRALSRHARQQVFPNVGESGFHPKVVARLNESRSPLPDARMGSADACRDFAGSRLFTSAEAIESHMMV